MKKLLPILFLVFPFFINAQNEGMIKYEEVIQLNIELPEGMDEKMKAHFPSEQKMEQMLYFTENETMYKSYDASEEDETVHEAGGEDSGVQIKMVIAGADNQYYRNLKSEEEVQLEDFMGKKFLIKGKYDAPKWKMTGKQKQVGKYICQQAVSGDGENKTEAWFTPQIPVSIGPSGYGGLPGAILEVVTRNGDFTISAVDIKFEGVPANIIVVPTKGKKVTQEEFEKIRDEKLKEMGAGGNGTSTKIEIRTN